MSEVDSAFFDENYYERGLETGKSNYSCYRWIPELTIPLAMSIIDFLEIKRNHTILDFGCSKGYLVKALRILHREAWGIDISKYAIDNVPLDVKPFCFLTNDSVFNYKKQMFDFCIAKDVFEHLTYEEVKKTLMSIKAKTLFAIIPLGEKGEYYSATNNLDPSHKICLPEHEWEDLFIESGWKLLFFTFNVPGIKENYISVPKAHGFFVLRKEKWI